MSGITAPVALLAGLLSFLSPCFLPVVPVFVAYLLGDQAGTGELSGRQRALAARQAGVFVLGFSTVFIALWASVGLLGNVAGAYREPIRITAGAILIVLGLHQAGLIEIPFLQRQLRVPLRRVLALTDPPRPSPAGTGGTTAAAAEPGAAPGGGPGPDARTATATLHGVPAGPVAPPEPGRLAPSYRRSALLGLAFGAGWTPCIGPILGGVLGLASAGDSVAQGSLLLAVYCLGLGIPFVLVAAGATEAARRLRRIAARHGLISAAAGGFLVLTGFLMITDLLGQVTGLALIPGM